MENEEIVQFTDTFNQFNFINCQKLADMNDPSGCYWIGYCYEYGIGIEKDENKAFTYYQKSADVNYSNGMYQVGYCYNLGIGVEIDKKKAFTYYLKSAEAGNSLGIWKTALCYCYGIGVEKNDNKFIEWIEKDPRGDLISIDFSSITPAIMSGVGVFRESRYGKCSHCNEDNTNKAWCISCDPDIATRWTIRNKEIDNFLKTFQLRTWSYEGVIEWIPFDRLSDVKEIGKGGFGSVYKATWLDGIRKVDGNDFNYVRARDPSSIVALKTFSCPLTEVDNYMKCNMSGSQLKIYGLTQDIENKYLVVFQYADNGNLYKFLKTKFQDLTWKTKLKLLGDIVNDLGNIHLTGYIHANLHGGNILQDQGISTNLKSYISDLGLSKKKDENDLEGGIYGVMPYVAPEVLLGKKFTNAADIYSFGVIMSEMSTGQRAFDGYEFDTKLAVKICKGLRPGFIPGTPDCYIELANQCMNLDPQKRPDVHIIWDKFQKWNESMESSNNSNEIKKQFLEADKIVKTLPLNLPKHPDFMYTSKIINTKKISIEINNIN